jgi:hypothetical protein
MRTGGFLGAVGLGLLGIPLCSDPFLALVDAGLPGHGWSPLLKKLLLAVSSGSL